MEDNMLLVIVFLSTSLSILLLISRTTSNDFKEKTDKIFYETGEITERFYFGTYLHGLPAQAETALLVYCGVTEDSFVFRRGTQGDEIGCIPRQGIKKVAVFKEKRRFCVSIDWVDTMGSPCNTVFAFTGKGAQSLSLKAGKYLNDWLK
jgi:hypothetical protein